MPEFIEGRVYDEPIYNIGQTNPHLRVSTRSDEQNTPQELL
jgi:hypothetical protein